MKSCLLIMAVLAALATACVPAQSPRGLTDSPLKIAVLLDRQAAFAASPDGRLLAYGNHALVLDDGDGESTRLAATSPMALNWRQDGERFAAGFAEGKGSDRVAVFDRTGQLIDEHVLPGRILAISWNARNELLVAGYRLREYSFGVNLTQWLWRSDGQAVEEISLGDVTIEPATARQFAGSLRELLRVSFSPDGDELVFLRLHDPPQFPPYLQLLYRNWQVPAARKLLALPVQPVTLAWSDAGEAVLCQTGNEPPRQLELWPAAVDPAQGDKRPQRWRTERWHGFPVQVLADGRYLVAMHGRLYAGHGLPAARHYTQNGRLWSLRKWRFEGLITPAEFVKSAGAGAQP